MRVRRFPVTLPALLALAIIAPLFQAGCGDDSKTTGSQLQLSEEAKAQIIDMKDIYKENEADRKKR